MSLKNSGGGGMKTMTYDYSAICNKFDDYEVYLNPRVCHDYNGKSYCPPFPMQFASRASGFVLAIDEQIKRKKDIAFDSAQKLKKYYELEAKKKEEKENIELEKFIEEQKHKKKLVLAPNKKISEINSFFSRKNKKELRYETCESVQTRRSIHRCKTKLEKKIIEDARSEYFNNVLLINDEMWLDSIRERLGIKKTPFFTREVLTKLNISTIEAPKLVQVENEIVKEEISTLSEEQVAQLEEFETKENNELLQLVYHSVESIEKQEKVEVEEKLEISLENDSDDEYDLGAILKKVIKTKVEKVKVKKVPKFELPKMGCSSIEKIVPVATFKPITSKVKKNRLCRSLKLNSESCKRLDCSYLHNVDDLQLIICKYAANCKRVQKVGECKYINIDGGCQYLHQGETLDGFLVREGFKSEVVIQTKIEETQVNIEPKIVYVPSINKELAWKQPNSKILLHNTQIQPVIPVISKVEKTVEEEKKVEIPKLKTMWCDSLINGTNCRHGLNCRFAHSIDELSFPPCFHSSKCLFVKKDMNGNFYNSQGKFCKGIHPQETKENYLFRNGIVVPSQPKIELKEKTVICNTVFNGVKCTRQQCYFAHNEHELNIRECTFPSCRFVTYTNGKIINVGPTKCKYFHKGETKSSYFTRMMN